MHSSCSLHPFLFLLYFCVFFSSFGENSVSALFDQSTKNDDYSLDFLKAVEDVAHSNHLLAKKSPNLLVKSIKTAIETSSKFIPSHRPLTFFTALKETCLVNQTHESLKITILNSDTIATMTGGALGKEVFQFYIYSFFWQDSPCNEAHNLEAGVIYFNLKYGSYDKAMDHPDGIAMVNFPISTIGNFSNPKFNEFFELLQSKIKGPGCHATIDSAATYTWFVNFPLNSIYHTYMKEYRDEDTGKTTKALVLELPLDPRKNYISYEQFEKTFLKMAGSVGQVYPKDPKSSAFQTHQGIYVCNLPA